MTPIYDEYFILWAKCGHNVIKIPPGYSTDNCNFDGHSSIKKALTIDPLASPSSSKKRRDLGSYSTLRCCLSPSESYALEKEKVVVRTMYNNFLKQ